MRSVLAERQFPVDELRLFASARSAGRRLPGPSTRSRSRTPTRPTTPASTSCSSPPAVPPPHGWRRGWPTPGRWWSTTPRPGAWTPTSRWWCPRSTPTRSTPCPQGHRGQPQLHDHGGHAGAQAPRTSRPACAPGGEHLPGRVGCRPGRHRRARRAGAARSATTRRRWPCRAPAVELPSRRTSSRPTDRLQRDALRRDPGGRRRSRRPTRSRSSATRAARSSSSPIWPWRSPACGCRCSPATRCRSTPSSREPITPEQARRAPVKAPGVELVERPDPAAWRPGSIPPSSGASGVDPDPRARPVAVPLGRQPAQGRGPQRRADRRSPARAPVVAVSRPIGLAGLPGQRGGSSR